MEGIQTLMQKNLLQVEKNCLESIISCHLSACWTVIVIAIHLLKNGKSGIGQGVVMSTLV